MATVASPILHDEDLDSLPLDPRYTHPIKPAALAAMDGPLLERTWNDHPAIDWIGRWDSSKTARWAGSSLRFRFDGPLLFLVPGPKTLATESPMIGWQIEGKTYTSHARSGRSIRLWPPEGVVHKDPPVTPSVDSETSSSNSANETTPTTSSNVPLANPETTATPARPTLTGSRQSTSTNLNLSLTNNLHVNDGDEAFYDGPTPTASTFAHQQAQAAPSPARSTSSSTTPVPPASSSSSSSASSSKTSRLIEITLIDWGSIFQVNHFEMLAGSSITPAYPHGISNLPTLLFIGDSLTSGFIGDNFSQAMITGSQGSFEEGAKKEGDYSGFLDAFPSQLRSYLAPGIRVYSIAFPGVALVDDSDSNSGGRKEAGASRENGMESKFFKRGPLEPEDADEDNDWTFEDREDGNAPTHIFVNLGTNDAAAPVETFLSTLENFLGLLKETYGRRTGDILVMSPFGQYTEHADGQQSDAQSATSNNSQTGTAALPRKGSYKSVLRPHIKRKIEELSQEWSLANEDPFASGDFPDTPILEYTKSQLELGGGQPLTSPSMKDGISRSRATSRPNSASYTANTLSLSLSQQQQQVPDLNIVKSPSVASLASTTATHTTRPALIVRPSSIAAAVAPNEEKGTKTRLHFIDTLDWLDDEKDTFDGIHPTKKGARKIAKKLKGWLGDNGFLADA
ncbi:hypothetical protein P389DRAFT_193709 [Cystobasidium minutum MCA 4210]|uniref:uncharacterized protein n=1 Tax=Cystobasidium minutum MCA 4210 TaxID=1397322 RepID=UPI0034CD197D|eukprot:jgi/Rhomi1/193709/gm1.1923_g